MTDIAVASHRTLARSPADAAAWRELGIADLRAQHVDRAMIAFSRLTTLAPGEASARVDLANALKRLSRDDDAERSLRRALVLAGALGSASESLANTAWIRGRTQEARRHYVRALATQPSDGRARLGACVAELPVLYETESEIDAARARYTRSLAALEAWAAAAAPEDLARLADSVGATQPFFLAYQARDDRELQSRYGRLVCRALATRHPDLAAPPPRRELRSGERLRIGLVSGYFRRHSVWKMALAGWVDVLDRARFEVIGYSTGHADDDVTAHAAARLDGFVARQTDRAALARRIRNDRIDFLFYPDIGMDPGAAWLAALKLAPIQAMTWGHPTTSGYPTMDLFLSSELMEPADGEARYVERLVRLPGLGCWYTPSTVAPAPLSRREIGLDTEDVAYLCAQSLFKYLPQDDELLVRIADGVAHARFVFFSGPMPTITQAFVDRLSRRLAAAGHDPARRILMLPSLTEAGYHGVAKNADVLLDSIGWSGFNSTIEVIEKGVPVVSLPGDSLRSRHTFAVLTKMGLDDMLASDRDDYVGRAVRLGLDPFHRRTEASRIRHRVGRLFGDEAPIRAVEEIILDACAPGGSR